MSNIHLITGGTGFVGAGIALELLRQTDAEVIGIVRAGNQSASERFQQALHKAALMYGYEEKVIHAIKERCHAVAGDVTQEACGVNIRALPERIAQFWHSAASLRYEDRYEAEIFQTNKSGTRHAIALAQRLASCEAFNYVSTAYVAGRQTGIIAEELPGICITNNHYETSKLQAELSVAHVTDMHTRIFRPSVVIGHSQNFSVASGFSGVYGFMRKLLQFKGAMNRVQEGLLQKEPLRLRVDPDALLNLVPLDFVARQAVRISTSGTAARVFHLTNSTPTTVATFLNLLFQSLELKAPLFAETKDQLSWIDRKLDQGITFYQSYLVASKSFERTQTDAALGSRHEGAYELTPERFHHIYQWYLDLLAVQRPRLIATR